MTIHARETLRLVRDATASVEGHLVAEQTKITAYQPPREPHSHTNPGGDFPDAGRTRHKRTVVALSTSETRGSVPYSSRLDQSADPTPPRAPILRQIALHRSSQSALRALCPANLPPVVDRHDVHLVATSSTAIISTWSPRRGDAAPAKSIRVTHRSSNEVQSSSGMAITCGQGCASALLHSPSARLAAMTTSRCFGTRTANLSALTKTAWALLQRAAGDRSSHPPRQTGRRGLETAWEERGGVVVVYSIMANPGPTFSPRGHAIDHLSSSSARRPSTAFERINKIDVALR